MPTTIMIADFFIDVGHYQLQKHGNSVCGDVFLSARIKDENRTIVVLSDGMGSGIKANILATMTATMLVEFTKANTPIEHTARTVLNTLPVDTQRQMSFASFTIVDIVLNQVKLIEFGNPRAYLLRRNTLIRPEAKKQSLQNGKLRQSLYQSVFVAEKTDRLVFFTDGLSQSGIGQKLMPFGWPSGQIEAFLLETVQEHSNCSSEQLARQMVNRALLNDGLYSKDDISCACVYFREARKLIVATGPPYKQSNDSKMAERIAGFRGQKVICGGTTAQIVARELGLEIEMPIDQEFSDLPPVATMPGIDLVTEGVLTMGRLSQLLKQLPEKKAGDAASVMLSYLLQNDEIFFLVGTRVNEAHQDPDLPVELEIRRNVVKRIAQRLEENFLKTTHIQYI